MKARVLYPGILFLAVMLDMNDRQEKAIYIGLGIYIFGAFLASIEQLAILSIVCMVIGFFVIPPIGMVLFAEVEESQPVS